MKVHSVHRTYRNACKGAPMLFLRRLNAGLGFEAKDSFKRRILLLFPFFPSFDSFSFLFFFRSLAYGTRYYVVSELHLCRSFLKRDPEDQFTIQWLWIFSLLFFYNGSLGRIEFSSFDFFCGFLWIGELIFVIFMCISSCRYFYI